MAISSYKTYLMYKASSSGSYSKLVDVKSIPDLGGSPEMIETTTLSDGQTMNIPGIQQMDSLEFTANYTKTDYSTIKALEGTEHQFAVYFGDTDGTDGKFEFKGMLSVYVNGVGVNEVVEMTISIAASTEVTLAS